ncbi:MAG: sigma-70 family RNA polymerase sigma factor [Eubacteriales bacterium]
MSNIRYSRGKQNSRDMAEYARQMAGDNKAELGDLKRNLVRALREEVTDRQREMILLYYDERLNMREIGDRYGVSPSTVSRIISRGEARLERCIRYGAGSLLR